MLFTYGKLRDGTVVGHDKLEKFRGAENKSLGSVGWKRIFNFSVGRKRISVDNLLRPQGIESLGRMSAYTQKPVKFSGESVGTLLLLLQEIMLLNRASE